MKPPVDQKDDNASLVGAPIDEPSSDLQVVTFIAGDEVFAVDMAPVQEIIRVPEVVRVPLAPSTLNGLANLRGRVLPIISLRRTFGFPEKEHNDATRVVVIDVGQPLGFVVDRVASVMGVDPRQIEGVDTINSAVDTKLLSGLIKDQGGHSVIMVLDFAKLIEREFAQIALARKSRGKTTMTSSQGAEEAKKNDELQLVSFHVADQDYAIAIEDVQEIVQVPESIVHVPRSESHVLGVMTLRSRLLPLVSLRTLFGLPERRLDEKSRIVVLAFGATSVGVVVDGVSEVLRVAKAKVDAIPALLATDGKFSDVSAICRLDDTHLVSIITARHLFDHSAIKEALSTVNEKETSETLDEQDQELMQEQTLDEDEQVVIFRLGHEEFGAPIATVQEIVRVPETLIKVPKAPASVEGVINLRGTVLPVIDLRRRLGLPAVERTDRQRIMVFLIAEVRTGFIVDQVAEVLKVPKTAIEDSPQLSAEQSRLLSRMANLEKQKRMVQLLDPSLLVEAKDLDQLLEVTKEAHDQATDR